MCIRDSYEDMVARPEETIRHIGRFLDVYKRQLLGRRLDAWRQGYSVPETSEVF